MKVIRETTQFFVNVGAQAAQALVVRSYYFFNLYANVQLVKGDIVNAISTLT